MINYLQVKRLKNYIQFQVINYQNHGENVMDLNQNY